MTLNDTRILSLTELLMGGGEVQEELTLELMPLAQAIAWRYIHKYPARRKDLLARAESELAILVNKAATVLVDTNIVKYVSRSLMLQLAMYLKTDYLVPIEPRAWKGEAFQFESLNVPEILDTLEAELGYVVNSTFLQELTEIILADDTDLIVFYMKIEGYEGTEIAALLGTNKMAISRRINTMYERWLSHERLNGISVYRRRNHERGVSTTGDETPTDGQAELADGQLAPREEGGSLHNGEGHDTCPVPVCAGER